MIDQQQQHRANNAETSARSPLDESAKRREAASFLGGYPSTFDWSVPGEALQSSPMNLLRCSLIAQSAFGLDVAEIASMFPFVVSRLALLPSLSPSAHRDDRLS